MLKLFLFIILLDSVLSAQEKLLDSAALSLQKTYTSLDEALREPWKVYKLSLRYQHIETVPPQIGQLKNLQILDLSNNGISEVSDVIGQLPNLQVLDLSSQMIPPQPDYHDVVPVPCLTALNPAIGNLNQLTHLILYGHAMAPADLLQFVSKNLAKLKHLSLLDLRTGPQEGVWSEEMSRLKAMRVKRMVSAKVLFDSTVYKNIRMKPIVKMWVDSVTMLDSTEVIREFLKKDKGVEQCYTRILKKDPEMRPTIIVEFTAFKGGRSALKVLSEVFDMYTGEYRLHEPEGSLMPFVQDMQIRVFKRFPIAEQPVFIRLRYELSAMEE